MPPFCVSTYSYILGPILYMTKHIVKYVQDIKIVQDIKNV